MNEQTLGWNLPHPQSSNAAELMLDIIRNEMDRLDIVEEVTSNPLLRRQFNLRTVPFESPLLLISMPDSEANAKRTRFKGSVLHIDPTNPNTSARIVFPFCPDGTVHECCERDGTVFAAEKTHDGWARGLAAMLFVLMESIEAASDLLARPKRRAIARRTVIELFVPYARHPPRPDSPT